MTGGLEGRCSIQLSYEGWAVTMVAHRLAILAAGDSDQQSVRGSRR